MALAVSDERQRVEETDEATRQTHGVSLMRLGLEEKLAFIRWAASPDGPPDRHFLRPFKPQSGAIGKAYREACSGDKPIFLPCPPFVKVIAIRRYARFYNLRSFVETGTYLGDTTSAVNGLFDQCFTLELSDQLYERAVAMYANKPHIHCVKGDSGVVLAAVLQRIKVPTLFWLDAHYSAGITATAGYNPIFRELEVIREHPVKGHVILVDDARGMDCDEIFKSAPVGYTSSVKNDIIRMVPLS